MILPNQPGRFAGGFFGPRGHVNGFGRYWEPDMYPPYDILNHSPTQAEIDALINHRLALPTNTCSGFAVETEGGFCNPTDGTGRKYRVDVIRHSIEYNNASRLHYAFVRYPRAGAPTHQGGYPILLSLHGNTEYPIRVGSLGGWDSTLGTFYTDQCVVVKPLYLGYRFATPHVYTDTQFGYRYEEDCQDLLGQYHFDGDTFFTPAIESPPEGYTSNDLQIMAVLQALKGILDHYGQGEDPLVNGDVGIIGGSMGANMLYDIAPIMFANSAPGDLKVSIAMFGGTDQFAPFNVRRSKRYLKSQLKQRKYEPSLNSWVVRNVFSYRDISLNQRNRTKSNGVKWYLCPEHTSCPEGPAPELSKEEMKAQLRSWFIEESVARIWDYPDGPYPLQIHHGTLDPTVFVENSRWLRDRMLENDVPEDSDYFQYFETPGAGHSSEDLSNASRVAMAALLQDKLGWTA